MKYSETLLDHFKKPRNQGVIKDADAVGEVGNIKCGDIMKIYIKVDKDKEVIKDVKFETLGCAAAIAASSALTELAKGKTFDQALAITKDDVVAHLGGDVPAVKYHCSILAEEGLQSAITNYKNKEK
ncbi:iron-sulfur cluster assembly scaffold protein [Candidatus Falkowbacteria bacterium]|jgi:nitrogen fixation protein NifU and related proteins|nr:iron-sulfur cluster assembly scaffold protein [Candidatus Falkowbacteria bacterium]MBT7007681.1 iron-sulfur cluster assembly scaffold protein [Candidatus Falkowbacteria bacterium]